jgi:hypothetical protein
VSHAPAEIPHAEPATAPCLPRQRLSTDSVTRRPLQALAITLDREPPALRSTRNRLRTAVRQGASWTAAYHRQLTVAAVASPIRGRVGALGVLAAERSWLLLAQTASARSSLQPVSSGRASAPWSTRPAACHGVGRRCPACGVHPSGLGGPGSGCPAVRCPVTWGRRLEGSGARPSAVHSSGVQPSAVHPCGVQLYGVQPSGVCPVRPDASVSSHAQAVALGTQVELVGRP